MTSTAQESTVFDFDFKGSSLDTGAGGTDRVSVNSIFRIGSISKLFTVYAFLLNGGLELWERPVTEYVPELRQLSHNSDNCSDLDSVRWEEVTLGSLASQMSGIGRDCENPSRRLTAIQLTFAQR
jgi:CubicO group peptidase (beta-lactamase class C family)